MKGNKSGNTILPTILNPGIGGVVAWNIVPPESKNDLRLFGLQVVDGLAAYRRQAIIFVGQEARKADLQSFWTPRPSRLFASVDSPVRADATTVMEDV